MLYPFLILIYIGFVGWIFYLQEYIKRRKSEVFWLRKFNDLIEELNRKPKIDRIKGDEWKDYI